MTETTTFQGTYEEILDEVTLIVSLELGIPVEEIHEDWLFTQPPFKINFHDMSSTELFLGMIAAVEGFVVIRQGDSFQFRPDQYVAFHTVSDVAKAVCEALEIPVETPA